MRLSEKPESDYSLAARLVLTWQKKQFGRVLEPTKAWLRSIWLYLAFTFFYKALSRASSPVTPVLRLLLTTFISELNHCEFCIDFNLHQLKAQGMSSDKLEQLRNYQTSDLFSRQEKSALSYAESLTLSNNSPSDGVFKALQVDFSDDQIVEMTALIMFQNLSSKFNSALHVRSHGFCQIE